MKSVAFRALRGVRPTSALAPSVLPSASALRLSGLFSRAFLGLAFVVCAACQSPGSSGAEAEAQNAGPEEQVKASTSGEQAADETPIPTAEDYEEEMAQAITEKSDLGKELDALEQEIGE